MCQANSIRIEPTAWEDLPFVMGAEINPDNAPYIDQWSRSQHEAAIASPDDGHFTITQPSADDQTASKKTRIGYLIVSGLQDPHDTFLLRRLVIVQKGKGYGRQALQWIKTFAFEQLGCHRLWLDVILSNHRAKSLYLSEGFLVEGTLREAYKTDKGYEDMLILSLLATDR